MPDSPLHLEDGEQGYRVGMSDEQMPIGEEPSNARSGRGVRFVKPERDGSLPEAAASVSEPGHLGLPHHPTGRTDHRRDIRHGQRLPEREPERMLSFSRPYCWVEQAQLAEIDRV